MKRIALIEDDNDIAFTVRLNLEREGYTVTVFGRGNDGLHAVQRGGFDFVILDLNLPDLDGLTICRELRRDPQTQVIPIMMLTARGAERDRITGLELGADDYLAKPFQTEELIARLRALIRRASGNTSSELIAGDVRLDTRSGRVTLKGEPVKLTAQEYKLLSYLLHHKGKVVSRTELIEHIYDQDFDRDSNTIEVFVTRIRKKLGPDVITTIRGLGYSLDDPAEAPRG
jgi:two-component system OmpR family response regulator